MKVIHEADKRIISILSQKDFDEGTVLKRSQFALPFQFDNKHYLFHTLSRECVEIPEKLTKDKITVRSDDVDMNYLIRQNFFVREDKDECQTYCSILNVLRVLGRSEGITTYTILPTTFCNARCFYCYELDYHFTSMNEDHVNNLIQFIERTHADKELQIRWFGGEPLVGIQQIRKICSSLKERGIPFRSIMVSNGSLFTEDTVREAVLDWNLKMVQITLDGDEDEYNRRKNYFDSSVSPFQKVIAGIHNLLEQGIRVQIRVNMDFNNIGSILSLADYLEHEFHDKSHLGVYLHPLFFEQMSPRCNEIWTKCINVEDVFADKGFKVKRNKGISYIGLYSCIATDPSCVVIGADGKVFGCEHCNEESLLGFMSDKLKERKTEVTVNDIRSKCKLCPFLPDCTEFTNCPDVIYDCRHVHKLQLEHTLSKYLIREGLSDEYR